MLLSKVVCLSIIRVLIGNHLVERCRISVSNFACYFAIWYFLCGFFKQKFSTLKWLFYQSICFQSLFLLFFLLIVEGQKSAASDKLRYQSEYLFFLKDRLLKAMHFFLSDRFFIFFREKITFPPGVDFTIISRSAFTSADPKMAKRH